MAPTWILVPSLVALRGEFNQVAPNRDKDSDGSIGDQEHATGSSGHNPDETGRPEDTDADSKNEVRAIDVDSDLRVPGLTMEMCVQFIVMLCRTERITWIKYIIYRGRIWSRSSGWITQRYTGSNPHDKHAHFSCRPDTTSENTTRPVGLATLLEEFMPSVKEIAEATAREILSDGGMQFLIARSHATVTGADPVTKTGEANVLHSRLNAIAAGLRELGADVADVRVAIDHVDEEVIMALGDASRPPVETAQLIATLLGNRAGAVFRAGLEIVGDTPART